MSILVQATKFCSNCSKICIGYSCYYIHNWVFCCWVRSRSSF